MPLHLQITILNTVAVASLIDLFYFVLVIWDLISTSVILVKFNKTAAGVEIMVII